MIDDFVEKAFAEANKASIEKECDAYMRCVGGDEMLDVVHLAVAKRVGLAKMDKLCEVVIKGGEGDTLAEYANELLLVGFHLGYQAALVDSR